MTQKQAQGNPPVKEFKAGGIKAAIWKDEVEQDGQVVVRHSIKTEKSYKDKATGEWKTTDYFRPNDLPRLILAAQKAFEFCVLKESPDEAEIPV